VARENRINRQTVSGPWRGSRQALRWLEQVGVTPCTRLALAQKKLAQNRQHRRTAVSHQEAIDEFHRRASTGELSQAPKVPARKEVGIGGLKVPKMTFR